MTVEDCLEDERWGDWWVIQKREYESRSSYWWRVIDAPPDCGQKIIAVGKSSIDVCIKALATVEESR